MPGIKKFKNGPAAKLFQALVAAFAAGALLACACFLLLFESSHYVAIGWPESEVDVNWRWGTMVISGFLMAGVLDAVVSLMAGMRTHTHGGGHTTAPADAGADDGKASPSSTPECTRATAFSPQSVHWGENAVARVRSGVLLGDLMHNLADGFFVGTAFRYCGSDFGWSSRPSWGLNPRLAADRCTCYSRVRGFSQCRP